MTILSISSMLLFMSWVADDVTCFSLVTPSATFPYSTSKAPRLEAVSVENMDTSASTAAGEDDANVAEKNWEDDGFVFGLDGSGLERPQGRQSQIVLDGDSLETQPYQVAAVLITFTTHAAFLASAFSGMLEHSDGNMLLTSVQAFSLLVSSWIIADFGSGVLHWSVDNYGNGKTPVMGGIIAAFQGHHSAPWTITEREFCNNIHKLCIPFGPLPMVLSSTFLNPSSMFFLSTFCMWEILSQEFHKWSHQRKSETPAFANWLQDMGVTIARAPHAQHHIAPYDGNYCIISGMCNTVLDESGFFRRLEHAVYKWNGVESNAWKLDPSLKEKTLAGDYRLG